MIFVFIFIPSLSFSAENVWKEFIKNPNSTNYEECKKQVIDSQSILYKEFSSPIYKSLFNDYGLYLKLMGLIEEGNEHAVKLGFQFHNQTNSSLKELLNVALGKNIIRNPELFLKSLRSYRHNFSEDDYYGLLLNYGDDFVDKKKESINETKRRISSLESVSSPDLKGIKDKCITVLKGFFKN